MISETIPLAGVIGHPISHSLSPKLHGHWLAEYGINGHYIPIDLDADSFEEGLKSLARLGFRGVNVTVPYKERVLTVAAAITDRAALIGAANTITFRKDGKIHADNTDGIGFIANLRQEVPNWQPSAGPAMVLGAGGASRAVISALISEGAPKILLVNRTTSRAEMLQEHFGGRVKVLDWSAIPLSLSGINTLVNTTVLGMTGQPELAVNLDRLKSNTLVTDIVYNPLKTDLLERAEQAGCQTVDGLGMLLHQAVTGFETWFRKKPIVDAALRDAVLRG